MIMATVRTRRHRVRAGAVRSARSGPRHETRAILILGTAALLLLSVASYGPAGPGQPTMNLVGPVGQRLAEILLALFGLLSYAWIAGIALVGVGLFFGTTIDAPVRRVLAGAGFLSVTSVIVHLAAGPSSVGGFPPGGVIAAWAGELSRALFHTAGSLIIFCSLALSLLLYACNRSLIVMLRTPHLWVRELLEGRRIIRVGTVQTPDPEEMRKAVAGEPAVEGIEILEKGEAFGATSEARPAGAGEPGASSRKGEILKRLMFWRRRGRASQTEPAPTTSGAGFLDVLVVPKVHADGDADTLSVDTSGRRRALSFLGDPNKTRARLPAVDGSPPPPPPARSLQLADPESGEPEPKPRQPFLPECGTAPLPTDAAGEASSGGTPPTPPPEVVEDEAMNRRPEPSRFAADQELPLQTGVYNLPAVDLLHYEVPDGRNIDQTNLHRNAAVLVSKLADFGVECTAGKVQPGPVVTMYEVKPAPGVKAARIASLETDLAMALQAEQIRIVAPIPGRDVVGIEVPNAQRETVYLKEIFADKSFCGRRQTKLPLAVGKDIFGRPVVGDLARMPHLLVAGVTGSGKSVAINSFILSLLYSLRPDQARMLMVDPKMLELSVYEGIPHLLMPVITDAKRADLALRWLVMEMERRYELLKGRSVRSLEDYNVHVKRLKDRAPAGSEDADLETLPYIVVVIDEFADLMFQTNKKDFEANICRLAAKARAAGIHLIVATQRPSVDVITGLIKANFPTRISFKVTDLQNSRVVLDTGGAQCLLGRGDMLYQSLGANIMRAHGAYVSTDEVLRVVDHVSSQYAVRYDQSLVDAVDGGCADESEGPGGAPSGDSEELDELYDEAVFLVTERREATVSKLQRYLKIGYNRAARIMEQLEHEGIVGPQEGPGPRKVLVAPAAAPPPLPPGA